MKHLGDITKINGAEIETVDVITGGSPCQDLSIAGKRAGLAGARSGLFMEQIRIVKEMRAHDKANGRTGDMVRPRFMVWENVPGAFSSNKGQDFAAVLEEIIRIAEPEAPDIEVPEKGWNTWGGYHDEVGGRWSVAWRVHDAQHWGVPQRRRRISVVADFGGDTAGEILFERKSVPGNIAESGLSGEGFAEAAESGFNPAVARSLTARADGSPCADRGPNIVCSPHQGGCDGGGKGALVQEDKSGTLGTSNDQTIFQNCLTQWDCQSKRIFGTEGASPTLQGGVGGGVNNPAIFCMGTQQGGAEVRSDDRAPTLTAAAGMSGNNQPMICAAFKAGQGAKANGIGYAEECAPTLGAVSSGTNQCPSVLIFDRAQITSPNNRSTVGPDKPCSALHTFGEVPAVCYQMQGFGDYREGDVASNCKQRDYKDSTDLVVSSVDCRNFTEGGEINGTLQAKESVGQSLNLQNTVRTGMIVRRLTPMECERLQGFPDHWTDIGEWRDSKGKLRKPSDSPRYKALGNSIALPFWDFLAKRISAQYLRPVTMGSLFDGIGGFPLVFERHNGKGTARWASEIEEFPIAVTKLRFGEE
jgi:DNA (cytosine-5)-methyltransferase 1